jgi:polysaccharide biosynthesis transport protein
MLPEELSAVSQEGYRTLRSALTARGSSTESRSFLVTGSGPGEGKSTTAINLAAALAQTGASVILIEADLRRPTFASTFGLHLRFGIEEVLGEDVDLAEALVPVRFGEKTINVLAARRSGVELADRMSYAVASKLVADAKTFVDFVVVDSPPLTTVTDALPFAQLADEIVIVVRLDQDRRNKLIELDDLLRQHRVPATGVVIVGENQVSSDYYAGYVRDETDAPAGAATVKTIERATRQYGWDDESASAEKDDGRSRGVRRTAKRPTSDSPGT